MVQGLDEVGPKNFFLGSVKRVLHVMSSHMFAPQWPQFDGTSSFPKSPLRAKARSSAKSVAPGWLDRPLVTQDLPTGGFCTLVTRKHLLEGPGTEHLLEG